MTNPLRRLVNVTQKASALRSEIAENTSLKQKSTESMTHFASPLKDTVWIPTG
jgi:hypothetical protein